MLGMIFVIIIILGCMYLYMIKPNQGRKEQMKPFEERYIAHRGLFNNRTEAPENSIEAFRKAVKEGYGIELDVQLTKDGQMVVFHDAMLSRMCGVDKKLTDCTFSELQQYKLAESKATIPLFRDVLEVVDGQVPLVIEIKPEGDCIGTAGQVSAMMKHYKGIYCFESFHPGVVRWYRKHDPDIIRGQLSAEFKKGDLDVTMIGRFILSNLMMNFYGKPDFIAYKYKNIDKLSYRICKKLYDFEPVGWTFRDQESLDENREKFKIFIFDSFIPDNDR